jgi:hypothetical protein
MISTFFSPPPDLCNNPKYEPYMFTMIIGLFNDDVSTEYVLQRLTERRDRMFSTSASSLAQILDRIRLP